MQLVTLNHHAHRGWSAPFPTSLDSSSTLVLTFGGSSYRTDPVALTELATAYPLAHHIGCSTSGEIFETIVDDDSLAIAIVRFEQGSIRTAFTRVATVADSRNAGREIASALQGKGLRGIFLVSDGLCVNGSELVRGINEIVPPSVTVTGGLAGDGSRFEKTWVLYEGAPCAGMVAAVGFYGASIHIGHGSKGGWDGFGPERTVTSSRGNVLFTLDGKPALELYKKYLGERASGLPATGLLFPLSLRENAGATKNLVRTILAVNEADQSMTFAGDIPEGSRVQLMRANFDRLVDGAIAAAEMANHETSRGGDCLSIAVSCVGRRLVLGERAEEECEATLDVLPRGTRQIGFYSYGEISPFAAGSCDLHNQTMTLTTICES